MKTLTINRPSVKSPRVPVEAVDAVTVRPNEWDLDRADDQDDWLGMRAELDEYRATARASAGTRGTGRRRVIAPDLASK